MSTTESIVVRNFYFFFGNRARDYLNYLINGEERGVYRVLLGKPEGKRPLGRPKRRWVRNIRMDLQEVGCGYRTGLGWPRIERGGGRL
jgi:hypothetical protein